MSSKFEGPLDPGPGALAVHQAYWKTFLSNPAFYQKYPRFKMISKSNDFFYKFIPNFIPADLFEYAKGEEEAQDVITRDFSITKEPAIWNAFVTDMKAAATFDRIIFAKTVAPTTSFSPPTSGSNSTASVGNTSTSDKSSGTTPTPKPSNSSAGLGNMYSVFNFLTLLFVVAYLRI
jgi:hypothetical protein